MSSCKECGFKTEAINLKNELCESYSTKNSNVINHHTQNDQTVPPEEQKTDIGKQT